MNNNNEIEEIEIEDQIVIGERLVSESEDEKDSNENNQSEEEAKGIFCKKKYGLASLRINIEKFAEKLFENFAKFRKIKNSEGLELLLCNKTYKRCLS